VLLLYSPATFAGITPDKAKIIVAVTAYFIEISDAIQGVDTIIPNDVDQPIAPRLGCKIDIRRYSQANIIVIIAETPLIRSDGPQDRFPKLLQAGKLGFVLCKSHHPGQKPQAFRAATHVVDPSKLADHYS
jgi:hypothetical protein